MRFLTDKSIEGALICPICRSAMRVVTNSGASLFCEGTKKHCYDFSSRGYVNFMASGYSTSGDSKQAVAARSAFLNKQFYMPVAEAICDILNKYLPSRRGLVVDAGCGEGYYSSKIAEQGYSVFGVDLSKFAVDAAAKRANANNTENSFFAVSSVFDIPFSDGSADAVINVFAPCVEDEYFRLVGNGGIVVVVYAGQKHLMGLKSAIYDSVRENDGREDLPKNACLLEERRVLFDIEMTSNEDVKNLFAMTPYYWKTSKKDLEKLEGIKSLKTEIDMVIAVYKNNF